MADNSGSDEGEVVVKKSRAIVESDSEPEEAPAPKPSKQVKSRRVIDSDDEDADDGEGGKEPKEESRLSDDEGGGDEPEKEEHGGQDVGDAEDAADSEEEEGKGKNKKRRGVDDEDEASGDDDDEPSELDSDEERERRKKKRKIETELEDDDLELLEENLGLDASESRQTGRLKRGRRGDSEAEDEELAEELDDLGDAPRGRGHLSDDDMSGAEEALDAEDDLGDFVVDGGHRAGRHRSEAFDAYGADELADIFGDEPVYDFEEEEGYGEYEAGGEEDEGGVRKKAITLSEIFEPEIMKRKFLTLEDKEIKLKDVPERIQLCHIGRGEASDEELAMEAKWIYEHAYKGKELPGRQGRNRKMDAKVADTIKQVLQYMRNEHLEVPFIAYYRQDYYMPDLKEEDLWVIWDWDAKWDSLYGSRTALMRRMEEIKTLQRQRAEAGTPVLYAVTDADYTYAQRASMAEEVHDWHMFLNFKCHFELETILARSDKKLNPPKRDHYTIAAENGLTALTERFLMPARLFGENLRALDNDFPSVNKPPRCEEEPDDLASGYVTTHYPDKDKVMRGCVTIGVREYTADPVVRKFIRKLFYERCVMFIAPTERGKKEIDALHPYAEFKYLREKSLESLYEDDGLPRKLLVRMLKAESEGLVKISFQFGVHTGSLENSDFYRRHIRELCTSDAINHTELEWNRYRDEVALQATKALLVTFEKELRQQLLKDVRDVLSHRVYRALKDKVGVLPVAHNEIEADISKMERDDDYDVDVDQKYKVMGIYIGSPDRATMAVLVDRLGEYMDPFLPLKNFLLRERPERGDPKTMDMNKLKDFIARHRPFAIAVGCDGMVTDRVIRDLQRIVEEIHGDDRDGAHRIRLELVNPEAARLYAASQRARDEYPELPAAVLHAISLARRLQDPLVEFCGLADESDTLSALFLDEYQGMLGIEGLRSAMHRALVDTVNKVGVRVNTFKNHRNQQAVMQFCCGFGPRKAAQFLEQFDAGPGLMVNRKELVDTYSLGAKLLVNCCGFVCVRVPVTADLYESEYDPDPRDRTRIHFESYTIARTIARDALEDEGEICSCTDKKCKNDHDPGALVQRAMDRPDELDNLELEVFADMLYKQNFGKKLRTLLNIKAELQNPYKDPREWEELGIDERFALFTGETQQTLFVGAKVFVRIQRLQQSMDGRYQGIAVRLESDAPGFIPLREISDELVSDHELEQFVQPGEVIEARVIEIDKSRINIKLSCRPSIVANDGPYITLDRQYDTLAAQEDEQAELARAQRRVQKRQVMARGIQHPNFHNVTAEEAEAMLAAMDRGEAVIRPSASNPNQLSLTWKVWDGVYCHEPIKEEGRQDGFQIGDRLIIDGEPYDDLDEIIARRVQPMAGHVEEVVDSKYFKPPMTVVEVGQALADEKRANPQRIPYFLSIESQSAGRLKLAYMPKEKPIIEPVKIVPDGFRYRGQVHKSLNALIAWFKRNYQKPAPRPQQRQPAQYASHGQDNSYDQYFAQYMNAAAASQGGYSGSHHSQSGGHHSQSDYHHSSSSRSRSYR